MNTAKRGPQLPKYLLESFKTAYRDTGLPALSDAEANAVARELLEAVALVVSLKAEHARRKRSDHAAD